MKAISHRGNIKGAVPDKENRPSYIDCAIGNGYDVEIDVRSIGGELWLGHDEPQYKIEHKWIQKRRKNLWIHCKNLQAAKECWEYQAFCHSSDSYVYTSNGKIWLHDLSMKIDNDVIIPLMDDPDLYLLHNVIPYGVCTDYPSLV
tara:strand:+ start:93 stop:527 length:435 start_codon:yes stop_codon:yes gene_type:complete